jgi:serine/threonine protein kinase
VQAHRDIKPTNIMLTESRTVKITDFGISKALDEAESMTLTSSFLGSPHYMAPEQILDPRSADIRTDLYALGAVYYEMVSGEKAYPGNGTKEILDAHFELDPPRVDRDDPLAEFSNDLLAKLLAENPDDRFQTPAELVNHLARVVSGEVVVTIPRFAKSQVRMAAVLVSLAIVTVAILAFVISAQEPTVDSSGITTPRTERASEQTGSATLEGTATAPPTAISPDRSTGSISVGGASAGGISANEAARRALQQSGE